ncbi:hypothetical protein [Marinobacter mangrovi]|uniref:hypothetical protein n=1 Tax=Marinobacter mangrovi TaxID=2803918 RepID=UPI001933C694|nr:hypothetical protein [Marinobacter mangrovi]
MDNRVRVAFRCRPDDQNAWKTIFTGLFERNEMGMAFQDRMLEHFGEKVDARLEEVLEAWGADMMYLETWDQNGDFFSFEIPAIDDEEALMEDLHSVFVLCPVSELVVEYVPDGV